MINKIQAQRRGSPSIIIALAVCFFLKPLCFLFYKIISDECIVLWLGEGRELELQMFKISTNDR